MLELLVVPDTARTLAQFKGEKCKVGVKPMLSFSGTLFESPTTNAYTVAKSMFVDFFKGAEAGSVDVEGLQCLVTFAVGEEDEAAGAGGAEGQKPQIHMRVWRIVTKRSGQRLPRVEVEEMGPRIDFRVGRVREADEGMMKEALKKAKGTEVCVFCCSYVSCGTGMSAITEHLLILEPLPGATKEECGNRYRGRQDRAHSSWQAGPGRSTDKEDEGLEEGQRCRCGR